MERRKVGPTVIARGRGLHVYEHETVIECELYKEIPPHYVDPPERKEGDIVEFSPASRRRLRQTMMRLRTQWLSEPYFITLTYHQRWPRSPYNTLRTWLQWIEQNHPGKICYIWRLEWQKRQAPHFHVLIWERFFDGWFVARRNWRAMSTAWSSACGELMNHDHLRFGCKIVRVESFKQATRYVSKYIAKLENEPEESAGKRRWGRSLNLPVVPVADVVPHHSGWMFLVRICKRLLRKRMKDRKGYRIATQNGVFSLYIPYGETFRLLEWIHRQYPPSKIEWPDIPDEWRWPPEIVLPAERLVV